MNSITQNYTSQQNFNQVNTLEDFLTFYTVEKNSDYGKFIEKTNKLADMFGMFSNFHVANLKGSYTKDFKLSSFSTPSQKKQYKAYRLLAHLAGQKIVAPNAAKATYYNRETKEFDNYVSNVSYFDLDTIFETIEEKIKQFVFEMQQKYYIQFLYGKSRSGATRLFLVYKNRKLEEVYYLNRLLVEEIFEFFKDHKDKTGKLLEKNDIKRTCSNKDKLGTVVSLPCSFVSNGTETIYFNIEFEPKIPLENQYEKFSFLVDKLTSFLEKNISDVDDIVEFAVTEYKSEKVEEKVKTENKTENKTALKTETKKENKQIVHKSEIDNKIFELNTKIISNRKYAQQERMKGLSNFIELSVKEKYIKGNRNDIIFVLSALLIYQQHTLDETIQILTPLLEIDEEKESRLALIKRTYFRAATQLEVAYIEKFKEIFEQDINMFISSFHRAQTLATAAMQLLSNLSPRIAATAFAILNEAAFKQTIYGKIFLSYEALCSRYKRSKSDISAALRALQEKEILILIETGSFIRQENGSRRGSEYKLNILNTEPKNGSIEEIFSEQFLTKINFEELKESLQIFKNVTIEVLKLYKKTKYIDRYYGINAFAEPDDQLNFKTKDAELFLTEIEQAIENYRIKYKKEKLEFHPDDEFLF